MFKRDWLKKKALKKAAPQRTGQLTDNKGIRQIRRLGMRKKCFYKKQIKEASCDQRATWKILNDLMGK